MVWLPQPLLPLPDPGQRGRGQPRRRPHGRSSQEQPARWLQFRDGQLASPARGQMLRESLGIARIQGPQHHPAASGPPAAQESSAGTGALSTTASSSQASRPSPTLAFKRSHVLRHQAGIRFKIY
jgi:hypothetical protein